MTTCKIVDAKWTDANELDLNWLEEHIKTCPTCRKAMGQLADMFNEELDEEEEEIE